MHEFFLVSLVDFVFFCLKALHRMNKCLTSDGPSEQEKIGQYLPIICSKIGHSYEAFPYLFGRNISAPPLSKQMFAR